jgi:transcriptional antiterminator RfaH
LAEAWYALNTKPHSEQQVNRTLVVRGFSTYLPMLPRRKDGRSQPLFSAYLFVRCDLEAVGITQLQWVPGLRRILSFEGRAAVVPDAAIELIRAKIEEIDALGGLPPHNFKPGDEVVIEEGPLSGMRGIFQGPTGPAERVQILIRFLGQANRAEVPVGALRALSDGDFEHMRHQRGTRGRGRPIRYGERGASSAVAPVGKRDANTRE